MTQGIMNYKLPLFLTVVGAACVLTGISLIPISIIKSNMPMGFSSLGVEIVGASIALTGFYLIARRTAKFEKMQAYLLGGFRDISNHQDV